MAGDPVGRGVFTRRRLLRDAGAAIGLSASAATAGCLFASSAGASRSFQSELVDTSSNLTPSFLTAYSCDPSALRDGVGSDDALPEIAAGLLSNVDQQITGASVDDLERLTGQYGQNGGHTGGDLQFVRPSASHLVATGDVDVDAVSAWLSGRDAVTDLGAADGYRRYGTGGSIPEAFVVDASTFAYGNRDGADVDASVIAGDAIRALENAGGPGSAADGGGDAGRSGLQSYAPELFAVVDAVEGDTVRFATQFDLVAERPDTGTPAYDDVAASVMAAGVGATVDADEGTADVERVLRYRRDETPTVDAVERAFETVASDGEDPLGEADWSVSRDGRTVSAAATVDVERLRATPTALRAAFPIAAFEEITRPIDPRALGREAAPRVAWEPSVFEDGRVRIVHGSGSDVEDLVVQYDADGATMEERWDGPVTSGDAFETERAPEPDSRFDLVWGPGTANETILLRFALPSA